MIVSFVDVVIVIFIFLFAIQGFKAGAVHIVASFLAFLPALYISFHYNIAVASFINQYLGLSPQWSSVIAYIVLAGAVEVILSKFFDFVLQYLPYPLQSSLPNQLLGGILSALNGLFLITFFLVLSISLPLPEPVIQYIEGSILAQKSLDFANRYAGKVITDVKNSAHEISRFMTVEPSSHDRISLDAIIKNDDLVLDKKSEQLMVDLVNEERKKTGVEELTLDFKLREVARMYSQTMFLGRYFSHFDSEGHDVGYRLDHNQIVYQYAGENLAYAPNVKIAHTGLMNSEGHKRNILDPRFHRVGIGVIDAGMAGKMFTQVFAD